MPEERITVAAPTARPLAQESDHAIQVGCRTLNTTNFNLNVAESLPSSFTLVLYENYLLQDVMTRIDFYVVTENASMPDGDVTTKMIVVLVIIVTNKIVVCI